GERFDNEVALRGNPAAQLIGRRFGEGRFAIALEREAGHAVGEPLLDTVEQDIAARLDDVEQRHHAAQMLRARGERAAERHALIGRIDNSDRSGHSGSVTSSIFRLTLIEPIGPLNHPPNALENFPASPPATMILIFSGLRNFGTRCSSCSADGLLRPNCLSAIPSPALASARSSRIGLALASWIRLRTCALVQPSRLIVSACSGEMTSRTS